MELSAFKKNSGQLAGMVFCSITESRLESAAYSFVIKKYLDTI